MLSSLLETNYRCRPKVEETNTVSEIVSILDTAMSPLILSEEKEDFHPSWLAH